MSPDQALINPARRCISNVDRDTPRKVTVILILRQEHLCEDHVAERFCQDAPAPAPELVSLADEVSCSASRQERRGPTVCIC